MPCSATVIAVHSSYLHFSSVIDKLQSLIVQSLTSMQITDQRIDWLSPALVVMIDGETEGPCLSEGSVRSSSVPWTPMSVSTPHSCKLQSCWQHITYHSTNNINIVNCTDRFYASRLAYWKWHHSWLHISLDSRTQLIKDVNRILMHWTAVSQQSWR